MVTVLNNSDGLNGVWFRVVSDIYSSIGALLEGSAFNVLSKSPGCISVVLNGNKPPLKV